jgi:thimet oligopeptidase
MSAAADVSVSIPTDSPVYEALLRAEAAVRAIVAVPKGERTFANTLGALDDLYARLQNETNLIEFMQHVSTDQAERERGQRAAEDTANWLVDLSTREDLFHAIKEYAATNPDLSGEPRRMLEHTLRDYRRAGMELPREERARQNEIQKQINKLGLEFSARNRDDESVVLLTREELRGMDDEFLSQLARSGPLYIVPLETPTYMPVQEFCEVEATRAKMWVARNRRGGQPNVRLLEQILRLRWQAAQLLGYEDDVAYQTEVRMAKNAARVQEFYDELRPVVRRKAEREFREFTEAKRAHTGDRNASLQPWDWLFYERRLKQEKYAVDAKRVQQYFPLDRVFAGVFEVTRRLFGIEYRDVTETAASRGLPLWHPDVRLYDVIDQESGERIGSFYVDLFPRPNKYSHAAQFGLMPRKRWSDGTVQTPLVALVCNFTKPTADRPALLTHDEVETFFHEFGHALHSLLTRADLASFSGTAVARDFVEVPSQLFENWAWEGESLQLFARHYQTGDPIPEDLLAAMKRSRTFGKGLWAERQIYFGLLDLTYHRAPRGEIATTQVARELFSQVQLYGPPEEVWPQASFGHLMGYNSGYYGYLWSLVYAADIFERFRTGGLLSPAVGKEYRDGILAKGGTEDELEMVERYLGRKPMREHFLAYLGLNES